ncbi:hypothetical protein [Desulfobacula phenolica]|uniref:Uncharacterized protein n=1 Tax=Desulfobacula phenolica TaxID=90732 RepID=A0A1H2EIK2_9BACT|nr:hypothetical protein [Desulfobacula phenolica]SDT94972.1 hypothetical protein SAMN04487931_103149 [Desulfobacula phenolica]
MNSHKMKLCGTFVVWLSCFSTPFIFLLGLVLGVFIDLYFVAGSQSPWVLTIDIVTSFVLFLTLIVVGIYTHFSKVQKDQLIRQIQLSIMPSLLFITEPNKDDQSRKIKSVHNVGNGIAISVNITIRPKDGPVVILKVDKIAPNEVIKLIKFEERTKERGWHELKTENIELLETTSVEFEFFNIEGTRYGQEYMHQDRKHNHGFVFLKN